MRLTGHSLHGELVKTRLQKKCEYVVTGAMCTSKKEAPTRVVPIDRAKLARGNFAVVVGRNLLL